LVLKKRIFMAFLKVQGRSVPAMRRAEALRLCRWLGGCAMVAVATLGCGRPSGVAFAPVTGRVVVNGQPLAAGTIHFFPDESRGPKGPMSTGVLQSDGSYSLHGPGQNVGAMVGNHRVYLTLPLRDSMPTPVPVVVNGEVVVQTPQRESAAGTMPQIPKKFLQPETSAWTATVSEGKANVLDFEITK
jgi:hypothetical protein